MDLFTHVHGMVVHFPIALLLVSVVLELAALNPKWQTALKPAALVTHALGFLTAVAAVITGPEEDFRGVSTLGGAHETAAQVTTLIFGLLLAWRLWQQYKRQTFSRAAMTTYLVLSVVAALLLGYTGYLGGQMVYTQAVGIRHNGELVAPPIRHGARD